MRATDFEFRHQTLIRLLIVTAAFVTYLEDRDDIIWRFVKTYGSETKTMERGLFLVSTLLIGVSAYICSSARPDRATAQPDHVSPNGVPPGSQRSHSLYYAGEFLYALDLAFLAPLSGFIILVGGEFLRLLRLFLRDNPSVSAQSRNDALRLFSSSQFHKSAPGGGSDSKWRFRSEAVKWGLFVTMIVFSITLKDRYAEVLIAITIGIWVLINLRFVGPNRS